MKNVERRGTIKWFDAKKGYGFITAEDRGEDVFVHFSNIKADGFLSLIEGQTVEYEIGQGCNGLQAINVHATKEKK